MPWTRITSTEVDYTLSGNAFVALTTSAIDTTGATLIVIVYAYSSTGAFPIWTNLSDSKSNTWHYDTRETGSVPSDGGGKGNRTGLGIGYCINPTVGAGHTFTTNDLNFPAIHVEVWKHGGVISFDQQSSGLDTVSHTTWKPSFMALTDVLTPSSNGALVIEGFKINTTAIVGAISVNSGWTVAGSTGAWNMTTGYRVQTTATGDDPTYSWSGNSAGNFIDQMITFTVVGGNSSFPALIVAS